jgi:Secretion system C-terminal sorting domain
LTNTDEFDWNGLAWDSTYRSSLSYDLYGNRVYYWTFAWNNGWDTTFGYRSNFQYRNGSQVEIKVNEVWQSSLAGWNLQDSTIYHYNLANEWDTVSYYFHSIIGWTPEQRVVDITWHDFSNELSLTGRKQNFGSIWEDYERYRITYGPNESETWVTDVYNAPNWDSARKEVYINDYHEHQTAYEYYEWSGGWLLNSSELNDYTYDGNGQTTLRIREYYDGSNYVNERRFEYSNFFAGIASTQIPTLEVIAYPNPVADHLHFKLEGPQNGPVQIALYDMQGRLRAQTIAPYACEEVQIPISDLLADGIFVYRIQTKSGQATGKVVVQR